MTKQPPTMCSWLTYLLHGFDLGSRTYTAHRQPYVDGWADTFVEQLSLQENLMSKRAMSTILASNSQFNCLYKESKTGF